MTPENMVKVTVRMDRALHKALKIEAAQRGVTIGAVIAEALTRRIRYTTHGGPIGSTK